MNLLNNAADACAKENRCSLRVGSARLRCRFKGFWARVLYIIARSILVRRFVTTKGKKGFVLGLFTQSRGSAAGLAASVKPSSIRCAHLAE